MIFLHAGLLLLLKAANWLVDGSVALAESFGVSPLIIGLTIVAMGTSAPEVAASITLAAKNLGNTAIGNVYGSNIANLALVGGVCAIIRPINIKLSVLRRELPVMMVVALVLWPILVPAAFLSRIDGIILLVLFIALLILSIRSAKRKGKSKPQQAVEMDEHIHDKKSRGQKPIPVCLILIVVGLGGLTIGADLAVDGSVFLGRKIGLSKEVIGLTIIAIGTSLPELMTCVVAALKGYDDISVGTLVGSNIFNALLAIGCAGLLQPFEVSPQNVGLYYWVMIAICTLFAIIAITFKRINKISGLILTCIYIGYILYLLNIRI